MEVPLPDGFTARSAALDGPGGQLLPLTAPDGSAALALQIRPALKDHPLLQKGMDEVLGFLHAPGVPGVLPLERWDRDNGLFIYPCGQGILLAEVIARCAERGLVPGERAAVELIRRVSALLDGAARADGPVDSHGNLNPWRIVVYPDGDVALLGYVSIRERAGW